MDFSVSVLGKIQFPLRLVEFPKLQLRDFAHDWKNGERDKSIESISTSRSSRAGPARVSFVTYHREDSRGSHSLLDTRQDEWRGYLGCDPMSVGLLDWQDRDCTGGPPVQARDDSGSFRDGTEGRHLGHHRR